MSRVGIHRFLALAFPLCLAGNLVSGCRPAPEATVASHATAPLKASAPDTVTILSPVNATFGEGATELSAGVLDRLIATFNDPAYDVPLTSAESTQALARVGSPGLVVCYPVGAAGAAADQADFGAGCGLYLELHAAGRPELGQTPLLTSAYRAAAEIKQPTLQIASPDEGAKLAVKTGATHVALGEVEGDAKQGTLTYRLYRVDADGKAAPTTVGDPITASGSREQILAALPKMATTLRTRLLPALARVAAPPAPAAKPDGMVRLGGVASHAHAMTPEHRKTLAALWPRVPEAGVLYLGTNADTKETTAMVKRLTTAFPENPLVLSHIGYVRAAALLPHETALHQLAKRYPRSYALAHTEAWVARVHGHLEQEQNAVTRVVQDAPRNPDALLAYGWTLSSTAHLVRRGKFANNMSAAETSYVQQVYPRWFTAVRRAAEIDPDYGKAWLRVANAGTFAGETEEASKAYDQARKLMGPNYDLASWGLQMFHSKWGGDPAKLRAVAEDIAKTDWDNPWNAVQLATQMQTAGLNDVAQQMVQDLVKKSDAAIAKNPKERLAHYARAIGLRYLGDNLEAQKEFEQVAQLYTDDAQILCEVGDFYQAQGRMGDSETAYRNALKVNPQHVKALAGLGYTLKHMNKLAEAEKSLKQAVAISPDYGQAWAILGTLYVQEKKWDECIPAYRQAMRLQVIWPEIYTNLSVAYYYKKDWRAMIDIAEQGAAIFPKDANMALSVGAGYLETKEWDESIEASRRALTLNDGAPVAHHNLGMALIGKGEIAEGRKELERGLQLGLDPIATKEAKDTLAKHPG